MPDFAVKGELRLALWQHFFIVAEVVAKKSGYL